MIVGLLAACIRLPGLLAGFLWQFCQWLWGGSHESVQPGDIL
jgi:hypothetical protein